MRHRNPELNNLERGPLGRASSQDTQGSAVMPEGGDDSLGIGSSEETKALVSTATPIVTTVATNRGISPHTRRRTTVETISWGTRDEDVSTSCLGFLWRWMASLFLSLLVITPFVYRYALVTASNNDWVAYLPPDEKLGGCATDLNFSVTDLYDKIQSTRSICDPTRKKSECQCTSPLIPLSGVPPFRFRKKWDHTHDRNTKLTLGRSQQDQKVVFLGDSITEHFVGTDLGEPDPESQRVQQEFNRLFPDGLALGLAGDRTPQLLYRLQNGEMPDDLNPPVWWMLIGTNNLSDFCSPEAIFLGILRVVAEARLRKPDAVLVVNGLLPRPNPVGSWKESRFYAPIQWINARLECTIGALPSVEYFDATAFFMKDESSWQVDKALMPDWLHPSDKGTAIWGAAIRQRVNQLTSGKDR